MKYTDRVSNPKDRTKAFTLSIIKLYRVLPVVEEAGETVFWLELITESNILATKYMQKVLNEANEILAIMTSSRKTAGKCLRK
jgi:hypothetical protein